MFKEEVIMKNTWGHFRSQWQVTVLFLFWAVGMRIRISIKLNLLNFLVIQNVTKFHTKLSKSCRDIVIERWFWGRK